MTLVTQDPKVCRDIGHSFVEALRNVMICRGLLDASRITCLLSFEDSQSFSPSVAALFVCASQDTILTFAPQVMVVRHVYAPLVDRLRWIHIAVAHRLWNRFTTERED